MFFFGKQKRIHHRSHRRNHRGSISLFIMLSLSLASLTACGEPSNPSGQGETNSTSIPPAAAAEAAGPDATTELNSQEGDRSDRIVEDELGHSVTLPEKPARIFAPFMEDSLISLGVKPVAQWANGELVQDYLQDTLGEVPKADFSGGLPSPEALMALDVDLIILHTTAYAQNNVYEKYSKIAPTYVFKHASADLESSVTKLGDLLGKSTEAKQAMENYRKQVDEAKKQLSPVMSGKKAVIIRFNGKGVFLMGGQYFGGYVLSRELGFGQSKLVEKENSVKLSLELLPELDADYIFLVNDSGTGTARLKELTESSVWKTIPSVKNGHVYEVNGDYWLGSGLIAYSKMVKDVVEVLAP